MAETSLINYEEVTYPNFVHAQTHPNRLAVMARAYGLKTAPVEKCRVLEVGCGSGTNLLAMACNLPESDFVGIDLSENHIKFGKQAAAEMGVKNLKLICADLFEFDFSAFGKFEYIIAHGFFSWVPPFVREKLFELCRENLAQEGAAFISYNAFPGCHLRLMMREMMMFHTENIESPFEKVNQSVALLSYLKENVFEKEIYGKILENEYEKTAERQAELIMHDDLGDFNQPFYFHEFISEAEKYDLQFLSEAEYFHDKYTSFDAPVVKVLDQFGDDQIIRREQFFDFLKNRRFRQTLLCHKNANLKRKVADNFFDDLKIVCDLHPESESPDFAPQKIEKFVKPGKDGVTIDHPLTKAALFYLCEIFPRSVSFTELADTSEKLVKDQLKDFTCAENDREILKDVLMKIFGSELVNFFLYEPPIAGNPSEKPEADNFIRWQARNSDTLFTRRFRTKKIEDEFVRNLIFLCDGEHTREDIINDFREKILDGRLKMDGADETVKQKFIETLPETLENQLRQAAKLGLFIS
ncbi:MAG: methyltransferase regulatory domain-containing protein [Pyrinomonadaceae bacterium]